MTKQELINYIGNEETAERLVKIMGNPDLAKNAYDELQKSKQANDDIINTTGEKVLDETLHDGPKGYCNPPEWMFLYKGYKIDYKNGKVYIDGELAPITFTEWVPFEAVIRASLEYIEALELEENLHDIRSILCDAPDSIKADFNVLVKYFDNLNKDNNMNTIDVELGGKKVSICPKTGTVTIDGKDAGYKVDTKKGISEIYAEIAEKMGVANEPKKGRISLHDALAEMKEKLADAPVEVKASFNNIVKHLDEHKPSSAENTPEKPSEEKEPSKKSENKPAEEPKKDGAPKED